MQSPAITSEMMSPLSAADRLCLIHQQASEPVALTVSMQKTACVLLHMIADRQLQNIRPIFVDTQFHFAETQDFLKLYEELLDLSIHVIRPASDDVDVLEKTFHTIAPFYSKEGADACCHTRKVLPLLRELSAGYSGRIAGLMRSEGEQRQSVQPVSVDTRFTPALPTYHPLFDWTQSDVETYIKTYELPVHPLYEWNYASIGCFPCTTPLLRGETDPRAGRWRHLRTNEQEAKTYCSINPGESNKGGDGI